MQRRSEPSRTLSTISTNTLRRRSLAPSEVRPGQAVAERLGLPVRDLDLLEQALVHSSWLHEHPDAARGHNERLEFLGDAIVNQTISEALYDRHPEDDEGALSARRAAIVSTTGLAPLARRLELAT
jgi:ribonuclease-3